MKAGEWKDKNTRLMRFSYGNTHEMVQDPKIFNEEYDLKLEHRWCMFVSLNWNTKETARFIKSVTYHLHPTYKQSKIKITESPFLLSRVAWGYFEVKMVIEFQPSTGLGSKVLLKHMLKFEGKGQTQSFLIEVVDACKDKALDKSKLTKKIAR